MVQSKPAETRPIGGVSGSSGAHAAQPLYLHALHIHDDTAPPYEITYSNTPEEKLHSQFLLNRHFHVSASRLSNPRSSIVGQHLGRAESA